MSDTEHISTPHHAASTRDHASTAVDSESASKKSQSPSSMTSIPIFNRETTAEEVASAFAGSIGGKIVALFGVDSNSLGTAAAAAMASHNPAVLILAGSSSESLVDLQQSIYRLSPGVHVQVVSVSLCSMESVRMAASEVGAMVNRIDLLLNIGTALVDFPSRTVTPDGYELHFARNFLAPFLFTNSLLDKLLAAGSHDSQAGARIVTLTSSAYMLSPVRFSDVSFAGTATLPKQEWPSPSAARMMGIPDALQSAGYSPLLAYAQSNTAIMLFTLSLARALASASVSAFSTSAGTTDTDPQVLLPSMVPKTPSQGAATLLAAGLDPGLRDHSGTFLDNCRIYEPAAPHAADIQAAQRLWALGEQMLGEKYDLPMKLENFKRYMLAYAYTLNTVPG